MLVTTSHQRTSAIPLESKSRASPTKYPPDRCHGGLHAIKTDGATALQPVKHYKTPITQTALYVARPTVRGLPNSLP